MRHYLSIDIGGTCMKTGLVQETGALLWREKASSPASWEALMLWIEIQFHRAGAQNAVAGVAISAPGIVDPERGIIAGMSAHSVEYIMGQPFYSLRERLGVPVYLEQDANCAILGEYWQGNARGCRSAVAIVMGAGLGGGILLDGRILRGAHRLGGDIGYIYTDAAPDAVILSGHLSPTTIATFYQKQTGRCLTLPQMHDAQDDPLAAELYDRWLTRLALLILSLQCTVDPERVLLGGGISEWERLVGEVRRKLEELSRRQYIPVLPEVDVCLHRNNANLLGAVYALLHQNGVR